MFRVLSYLYDVFHFLQSLFLSLFLLSLSLSLSPFDVSLMTLFLFACRPTRIDIRYRVRVRCDDDVARIRKHEAASTGIFVFTLLWRAHYRRHHSIIAFIHTNVTLPMTDSCVYLLSLRRGYVWLSVSSCLRFLPLVSFTFSLCSSTEFAFCTINGDDERVANYDDDDDDW